MIKLEICDVQSDVGMDIFTKCFRKQITNYSTKQAGYNKDDIINITIEYGETKIKLPVITTSISAYDGNSKTPEYTVSVLQNGKAVQTKNITDESVQMIVSELDNIMTNTDIDITTIKLLDKYQIKKL